MLLCVTLLTPGCYFVDLAAGQLRLMNEQQPLEQAIENETDPARRNMLRMVPSVVAFGRDVMQLRPGNNYTGYHHTEAEGITFTVVGSERTRLEPYTWWFPFAGEVPYKGFFDEADAREQTAELEAEGFDAWMGGARAYSTLGFFRDPVLTTMMHHGPVSFAEVLLHEMAHGRFYVAGESEFNEQLASFVGRQGTRQYFFSHLRGDSRVGPSLDDREARRLRRDALVRRCLGAAEALYASGKPEAVILREREPLFANFERELHALYPHRPEKDFKINNARLLQMQRYMKQTDDLDRLWADSGGSWPAFWRNVERFVEANF